MKVQNDHRFELAHLDDSNAFSILQFVHKEPGTGGGDYVTVKDGTTNEEVLKALIHRLKKQYEKGPNDFTQKAIDHLKEAGKALQAYYDSQKETSEPENDPK